MTNLPKQIEEIITDVYGGKETQYPNGNPVVNKLIQAITTWGLEMVGSDEDDRPEITEYLISKDWTKGVNQTKEEIRQRIKKSLSTDRQDMEEGV